MGKLPSRPNPFSPLLGDLPLFFMTVENGFGGFALFFMTVENDLGESPGSVHGRRERLWGIPIVLYDRRERLWGVPIVLYDRRGRSSRNSSNDPIALARDARRSEDVPGRDGDSSSRNKVSLCRPPHRSTAPTDMLCHSARRSRPMKAVLARLTQPRTALPRTGGDVDRLRACKATALAPPERRASEHRHHRP